MMHFHYMTYIATPKHKNPCPRGKAWEREDFKRKNFHMTTP